MIGIVICTHGRLAQALYESCTMILGQLPHCATVAVEAGDGMQAVLDRLTLAIKEVDQGEGVVILCDMFGGTPTNLALSFLSPSVEVLTGVNLPMLLKLSQLRATPEKYGTLSELGLQVRDYTRQNIYVAGDVLRPQKSAKPEG